MELPVLDIRILAKRAFCKEQVITENQQLVNVYTTTYVRMIGDHPDTPHRFELQHFLTLDILVAILKIK